MKRFRSPGAAVQAPFEILVLYNRSSVSGYVSKMLLVLRKQDLKYCSGGGGGEAAGMP